MRNGASTGVLTAALLLLYASSVRTRCPAECSCRLSVLHQSVDCSSLQYTTLPAGLPADTSHLRLGYNNITVLRNGTLSTVTNVARLWLNDNSMETIESGAFKYMSSLSWINLENNKISSLHPDTFSNLNHLFKLVLSGNPIHLPVNSPFLKANSLQILDLENCGLEEIYNETFTDMSNLMTLRLGKNSLRAATLNLPSLSHLDLHKNSFGPSTSRLRLQTPRLLRLELSSCFFAVISARFLSSLPLLEFFDVSDNIIDTLNPNIFNSLPNLQKVNLTNNLIYTMPSNILEQNQKLESIDISNNPIILERSSILATCSARIVVMKRCRLRDVPTLSLKGFSNATELHLNENKLESISKLIFKNVPLLNSIYLDRNKIHNIEAGAFEDLMHLTFLDLSNNPLNQLPEDGPFLRSASLSALRLDACELDALPAAALRALPALRSLSLTSNRLAYAGDVVLHAAPALRVLLVAGNPWHCDCALRPLWLWCTGAEQMQSGGRAGAEPERVSAGGGGGGGGGSVGGSTRCPDAEAAGCGRPSNRRFATLAVLTCRENSEEELDLDDEVEWVGAAGGGGATRPPPDRLSATLTSR